MMKKTLQSIIVLSLICSINSNAQSDPKEKGLESCDAANGEIK